MLWAIQTAWGTQSISTPYSKTLPLFDILRVSGMHAEPSHNERQRVFEAGHLKETPHSSYLVGVMAKRQTRKLGVLGLNPLGLFYAFFSNYPLITLLRIRFV